MKVQDSGMTLKQCDLDKKTQAKTLNTLQLRVGKEAYNYDVCDGCLPELRRLIGEGEKVQLWQGGKPL